MRTLLSTLTIAALITACSTPASEHTEAADTTAAAAPREVEGTALANAHWLVGSWEMVVPDGKLVETWKIADDSTLKAEVSVTHPNGQAQQVETIELSLRKGKITYWPAVADQNSGKAIEFPIKEITPDHFLAENLTHDFPKSIRYRNEGDSILHATLIADDSADTQEVTMHRQPRFR